MSAFEDQRLIVTVISKDLFTFSFAGSLIGTWACQVDQADWLLSPHGSTCLNLLTTEIINLCYHACIFMWVLGLHAICGKYFSNWAISSVSCISFGFIILLPKREPWKAHKVREQLLSERLIWLSRVHRCQRPSLWDWLQLLSNTDFRIAIYCWQGAIQCEFRINQKTDHL